MRRKLTIYIIIVFLFLAGGYFVLQEQLPKMAGFYPFFILLVLLDLYLWNSLKNKIFKLKPFLKYSLAALYWLPLLVWIVTIISFLIAPYYEYDNTFTLYLYGSLFVVYISKIFPVLFLLVSDLVRIFSCAVNRVQAYTSKSKLPAGRKISRSRFLQSLGLITGGIVMSGFITGMVKWATEFKVWRQDIRLPGLPESFRGLRLVQISDLHLGSWVSGESLEEAVEIINSLDADLFLFTGDLVNYKTDEAFPYREILERINARYGRYAVLGNHDYGDYASWPSEDAKRENMAKLFRFFDEIGWKLLRNEHAIVESGDEQIALIGVENWSIYNRFPRYGDIDRAKAGTESIPVRILLSHDPSHWDRMISNQHKDIGLTLSGHTHGFQFGVEMNGLKWSPAKYLYKQWAGLYSSQNSAEESQYIYVNRGLGNIGYPGRIGILPEITLIELT